jgi:hypothetical protein
LNVWELVHSSAGAREAWRWRRNDRGENASGNTAQCAWVHEFLSRMPRQSLNDLLAFIAVARERSFTRAAA